MAKKIVLLLLCILMAATFLAPVYALEDNVTIVLDAGHGGKDDGASSLYTRAKEKEINLKIAEYIKEELSNYMGVTVLMTREDDTYVTLEDRCLYAKNNGATVFISLHNNIDENHHSNGSEIYVSHRKAHYSRMSTLASDIMNEFRNIGLKDNGIKTRAKSGDTFQDNVLENTGNTYSDYYAVIRHCTNYGIDSMIIEHAYLDSWNDYTKYYSNDEQIKQLAHCDAAGIVKYYGLVKKMECPIIEFDLSVLRKIFNI